MSVSPVGGGCISPTARITTDRGDRFFLKWGGPDLPGGMLAAEARGLNELRSTGAIRVPAVVGVDGSGPEEWLLLEWLTPGGSGAHTWRRLGEDLAALHGHQADRFGAEADNFIGSLHQANGPRASWAEFWRSMRLEPQLRMAMESGRLGPEDARRFDELFAGLDDLLAPGQAEGPSLLHGDLWSGNVHILEDGEPSVVDPSVYFGHREVDLAMAELFGGFDMTFRLAYEEAWPLAPDYAPARRAAYQLYYLLVHVNLFGHGYVTRTRHALSATGV